jgi:LysR family transcriptional regulator, glycine cleavage system transcriptional activator
MSLPLLRLSYMDPIRGFVAVGRRMSITQASQDLCLSQSAVSRQISLLEEQLGVKLLVRNYRSIAFTEEGERLFRSADSAVQQLQDVLGEIGTTGALRPVTLSASVGVTGLWILPRLVCFQQAHPGVDLRVSANNSVSDLRHAGVDLAIRYATAESVPAGAIRLFDETVAPVAHPSLGLRALRSAKDFSGVTLLDFDDPHPNHPWLKWREWLSVQAWKSAKPKAVLQLNQYDQVIQSAVAGQGVALGRLALIGPLIDENKLMILEGPRAHGRTQHAYWLIQQEETPRVDVRRVADWIIAMASQSQAHSAL